MDIGAPIDIQSSVNGWMSFNLTYLAQQALQSGSNHISVALYAESAQPGDIVYYLSLPLTIVLNFVFCFLKYQPTTTSASINN